MKLAMAQIRVEGGRLAANLDRAVARIEEAATQGCEVVVLPECLDVGWTHPAAEELAEPLPGPTSEVLAEAARTAGLYVVAGLTERDGERIYNAAVLLSPRGEILLKHRKINLLGIARPLYTVGDRLGVAKTSFGVVGVEICADSFPNSLAIGHVLGRMGADVLLSPCAWAVDADHDNEAEPYGAMWESSYGTIARLYDLPIVGVSNVGWITAGPWAGRKCIGCSLAVGADGQVLARGPYGVDAEALVVVEVDLRPRPAEGTSWAQLLARRGYEGP